MWVDQVTVGGVIFIYEELYQLLVLITSSINGVIYDADYE